MSLIMTATLAATPVAFPAAVVEAVVRIGPLVPVPRAAPGVMGLFAVRSRVLTLVDPAHALRGGPPPGDRPGRAVVLGASGEGYAVLVDSVEEVVAFDGNGAPPTRLPPAWAGIAAGVIDLDGTRRILMDIDAILNIFHGGRAVAA